MIRRHRPSNLETLPMTHQIVVIDDLVVSSERKVGHMLHHAAPELDADSPGLGRCLPDEATIARLQGACHAAMVFG